MAIKSVRWSTVTVYEFPVGMGGSAVPRRGGPAVGLTGAPQSVWSTSVDAAQRELATEEAALRLQAQSRQAHRHRRRVRWLKPLERIVMLEKAGYSEERIYRMLMESSSIAQSRRLSLRVASLQCAA
ncbi:hypothetical protein PRIC1_008036 [Phytophthora ramorum]|uniref:Uncharacterized protein n=1 Tax=Phytophthora ramorum TaxID=164328 RepID=H3H3K6_PHYRM|nr:hypothetical protein KRP23_13699 [Phytophthora ramorum]KAH7481619.1 hypothetical protein KRP23_4797 [Phytophthora ramorum]KAH7502894.1 hypothetical protein KRP22_8354 [Phytophthora ramorum]